MGTKPSNALGYELYVHEDWQENKLQLRFESADRLFGKKALGGAFNVYAYHYKSPRANWSFASSAGNSVLHRWDLADFEGEQYGLAIHGPNGFYRFLQGKLSEEHLKIEPAFNPIKERVSFTCINQGEKTLEILVKDQYKQQQEIVSLKAKQQKTISFALKAQQRWYDLRFSLSNNPAFVRQYAGRLENGKHGITDPLMA